MNAPTEDGILEQLRPRMRTARIAHLRRLAAGVLVVPMVGIGAAVMTADDGAESPTHTADAPAPDVEVPDFRAPEIGTASGDEMVNELPVEEEKDEAVVEEKNEAPGPVTVRLGEFGFASLQPIDEGFELLEVELESEWKVVSSEKKGSEHVLVIKKGDDIKIVTIRAALRDEVAVEVVDAVFPPPPTTTAKPEPEPEPEPEPKPEPEPEPVTGRWVVEVEGKGSFVVERDGEKLYLGAVESNEGFDHIVVHEQGWKVQVTFTNGEWNWHGKAYIDDNGTVQQHFWDEERIAPPVYQWAEIGGVGAAKFKLHDGQLTVKELHSAEGWGHYDYNQPGLTAKVDFEGFGTVWFIDAWATESGEIAWEMSCEGETCADEL